VCELLRADGHAAVDADEAGHCRWFDRRTGEVVDEPPYPVPAGWLNRFGWAIMRSEVARLAASAPDGRVVFLCGSAENEAEVRDLFDLIICLIIDDESLRRRLATRTSNAFGRHPEELAAAAMWNPRMRPTYERLGAVIVDTSSRPPDEVAQIVLRAVSQTFPHSDTRPQSPD
jgi:hypothetical protein